MPEFYEPLLARIDDRLVHGQVVVGCCEPLGAHRILLCDDEVASDSLSRKLYRAAVPPDVELEVLTMAEVPTRLDALQARSALGETVVVVARPGGMVDLLHRGVRFRSVQLGGAHMHEGGQPALEVVEGFFLGPEDRDALRELMRVGCEIVVQPVMGAARAGLDPEALREEGGC